VSNLPTHKVKGGYQWGHQKVYPTKAAANKQAAAIYASGYRQEADSKPEVKGITDPRPPTDALLPGPRETNPGQWPEVTNEKAPNKGPSKSQEANGEKS
jgi:hypothetical protein